MVPNISGLPLYVGKNKNILLSFSKISRVFIGKMSAFDEHEFYGI